MCIKIFLVRIIRPSNYAICSKNDNPVRRTDMSALWECLASRCQGSRYRCKNRVRMIDGFIKYSL